MNISLTPKLEGYVKQKVSSGMYNSASEVIREALRLLEERDSVQNIKRQTLLQELEQGIQSLNDGKGRAFDKESIKAAGRAKLGNNR